MQWSQNTFWSVTRSRKKSKHAFSLSERHSLHLKIKKCDFYFARLIRLLNLSHVLYPRGIPPKKRSTSSRCSLFPALDLWFTHMFSFLQTIFMTRSRYYYVKESNDGHVGWQNFLPLQLISLYNFVITLLFPSSFLWLFDVSASNCCCYYSRM